ncbi:SLAP domain-containing protein [Clostridium novyi]|uniref:Lipoprotein, putative n=2 Tax=Clostridiaceae TaxID=31979 RepID=A0Q2V0_CLONN|nr:SLAP domain-containing protein [Clostridium novyi]ABK60488.1 lipoprotein, putative [Clostridium novyi NT]KEH93889.1 hypothetical protein Z963_00665 [Clostridium botulinum C/D str. It1]KEH86494.1 hypothetical protein Z966_02715 [Clostridium novyi A str. NCTC 538]KEH89756.1 hypothetical protein Z967_06730 [Clostridium novyi A str. 4540]KEH94700.1 hypothetical protein Z964_11555 [Clostridium novyi A str. GD211209]
MKRILTLMLISFIFLFTGCGIQKNQNSSNNSLKDKNVPKVNQKYSFGPLADLAKINDKKKEELQNVLNNLGDISKDQVSFNPINARFNQDGSLIVDLFIRNGHEESIFNIDVRLNLIENGRVVASAPFSFTKEEFGVLESNNSRPWSILYYPEDLKEKNIKIDSISIEGENIQYEY